MNTFTQAFSTVLSYGSLVESRYGMTYELSRPLTVAFEAGDFYTRENINLSIGWMEALQLLAGIFSPKDIERVAPRARLELFTASMAYGPRIETQIEPLIHKLKSDPLTRQAILFIGTPNDGPTENQPCTTTIQFLLRDRTLRAVVSMRSWDLAKGMSYDVMMFGALTQAVANCLRAKAGKVFVTAGSPHVYENETHMIPREHHHFTIPRYRHYTDYVVWAWNQADILLPGETPSGIEFT